MRAHRFVVLGVASSLLSLGACGHTLSRGVRADQLGTKYARLSGYMTADGAGPASGRQEQTPGSVRHDVLLDEATLATTDGQETCVDLVLRTDSLHDEPIDQYELAFQIDEREGHGVVSDERVSVQDYAFTGEAEVFSVAGVSANDFLGLSMTQPTEMTLRVIERRARVCTDVGGSPRKVALEVTHPNWQLGIYSYSLDFEWAIQ